MARPIITLTTDFGLGSPYVAQMKGMILQICPDAVLVDITHAIAPQDIWSGAIALRDATPHFPSGTLHIAVVDPGVGSSREIVYIEARQQRYIGPDNGLLSLVLDNEAPDCIFAIQNRSLFRQEVSNTFHGRDIMAPVAARLAMGLAPTELGTPLHRLVSLQLPAPVRHGDRLDGVVTHLDSFGNAVSNIRLSDLAALGLTAERWHFAVGDCRITGLSRTYADGKPGDVLALVGSGGYLEVAVVGGSAGRLHCIQPGMTFTASRA